MSERNLPDLLERSADRHSVNPPPLGQMLARSGRARKRRAGAMALAASVVVGSLIASATWLFAPSDSAPVSTPPGRQIVPWKAHTPGPTPSPDLLVPLEGKPIEVSLILPGYERQSPPPDIARYEFIVRLANTGSEPVSLNPCPFYRVAFVKDVETGYLNCGEAPTEIPAAGHVDFAMEAPAHDAELLAREGGTAFVLTWELGTEGAEGVSATDTEYLAGSASSPSIAGSPPCARVKFAGQTYVPATQQNEIGVGSMLTSDGRRSIQGDSNQLDETAKAQGLECRDNPKVLVGVYSSMDQPVRDAITVVDPFPVGFGASGVWEYVNERLVE